MNMTNVNVHLRIMGDDFNVQEITDKLEIIPTTTWYTGDNVKNSEKKHLYTAWIYSTGAEETFDINTQVQKIESLFSPRLDVLCELIRCYDLDISFDIVIKVENDEPPAIYFKAPTVQFAAKLGAKFDVDLYID